MVDYKEGSETDVVWDLRRIWAEKIIGLTVQKIQFAMDKRDYPLWFHLLKRDLRTEIYKNLSNKERELVERKIQQTKEIIGKFPEAYVNTSQDPEEHEAIEESLCKLYILMTSLMQKNGLFGFGERDVGL